MKRNIGLLIATFALITMLAHAQSGPPPICKPCLFYSGDLSPDDPSSTSFISENALSAYAETYGEIHVPGNHSVLIEGILFQTIMKNGDKLDPKAALYKIRSNIFDNGGTLVSEGGGPAYVEPTGRELNGDLEYTVAVRVNPPVQLDGGRYPGTDYWFTLAPYCTNQQDPVCKTVSYAVSNTESQTNSYHLSAGVVLGTVFYWPSFDYLYTQCFEDGYSGQQCVLISFGLMGRIVQ